MNSLYSNNQVTQKEVNPRTTPWLPVSGKTKKKEKKEKKQTSAICVECGNDVQTV